MKACQYHEVFHRQFPTSYRNQLLVPRRMHHHVVRHRLWTLLRCIDRQFCQRCEVECEILPRANLLHLRSRCMHLNVFQHDFQPHHASTTPKKQQRKPSRHKQTKLDHSVASRHSLFLVSLPRTSKRVMSDAVRCVQAAGRGSKKRSNNSAALPM